MKEDNNIEFSRCQWVEYIRTLRIEEFRKMNLSSFKIAALIVFIITAFNKLLILLSNADIRHNELNVFILVFFLVSINNIYTTGWYLINILFRKTTINRIGIKKYTKLEKQAFLFGHVLEILLEIMAGFGYIFLFVNRNLIKNIINGPIIFLNITFSPNILLKLIYLAYTYFFIMDILTLCGKIYIIVNNYIPKYKINIMDFLIKISNNILEENTLNRDQKEKKERIIQELENIKNEYGKSNSKMLIFLFISSSFITLLILFYENLIFQSEYLKIFQDCIYIYGITPALDLISIYIANRITYSWLEHFEREIFKENMTVDQIKNKLAKEYVNKINTELLYYNDV